MIRHISQSHNNCPSCDRCAKYFGNQKLLENHDIQIHSEKDVMARSDGEDFSLTESVNEELIKNKNIPKKKDFFLPRSTV